MYFVYILKTSRNTLYTGITNDLQRRVEEHRKKSPKAAKYTRTCKEVELVYFEEFETRSDALKREYEIKQWRRVKKENLIGAKFNNQKYE